MSLEGIDHVQLAMPAGEEDKARAFYGRVLGVPEQVKPAPLVGRGGVWFASGGLKIHLGVEADFRPARKAHPAFLVRDLADMRAKCEAAGHPTTTDVPLQGYERFFVHDPFGNRIELLELVMDVDQA